VLHTLDKAALPRTLVPVALSVSSLPPDAFVAYFLVVRMLDGRTLRCFHRFSEASESGNFLEGALGELWVPYKKSWHAALSCYFICTFHYVCPSAHFNGLLCADALFNTVQVKSYVSAMARVLGAPLVEIAWFPWRNLHPSLVDVDARRRKLEGYLNMLFAHNAQLQVSNEASRSDIAVTRAPRHCISSHPDDCLRSCFQMLLYCLVYVLTSLVVFGRAIP
jgi:hypothetical protein